MTIQSYFTYRIHFVFEWHINFSINFFQALLKFILFYNFKIEWEKFFLNENSFEEKKVDLHSLYSSHDKLNVLSFFSRPAQKKKKVILQRKVIIEANAERKMRFAVFLSGLVFSACHRYASSATHSLSLSPLYSSNSLSRFSFLSLPFAFYRRSFCSPVLLSPRARTSRCRAHTRESEKTWRCLLAFLSIVRLLFFFFFRFSSSVARASERFFNCALDLLRWIEGKSSGSLVYLSFSHVFEIVW